MWQNWTCPIVFGVCACLGGGLGSSVCLWDIPSMFGNMCHLARNTCPSCVKSWCTVWSGRRCRGCLYYFLSTWTIF